MTGNDALQIHVQVVEDSRQNVESLVKKVQLMLDKDFKLKVNDEGAVQQLKEILNVLQGIKTEMSSLGTSLGRDTWGKLSDNTRNAVTSLNKLVEALSNLDSKFAKSFGKAFGTSFAKEMKKGSDDAAKSAKDLERQEESLSTSLVKTTGNLTTTVTALNQLVAASREAGSSTHALAENMRSMDRAGKIIGQIDKMLAEIGKRQLSSQVLGFDIGHLERQAEMLRKTRAEFMQIFQGKGYAEISGLGMMDANSLMSERLYGTQIKAIQNEMKAVDELAESMRRLKSIQEELNGGAGRVGVPSGIADRMRAAAIEIGETMQRMNGPRLESSVEVNTALKEQIRGYESLLKEASRASEEEVKGNDRVRKSLNDLLTLINDLNNKMRELKAVGAPSSSIASLQQTINTIQASYDRLSGMGGASGGRFIKTAEYDENYELYRRAVSDSTQAIREQNRENAENTRSRREAAKAAEKLSAEEQRLAQAMRQTNQHGFIQNQMLSDLKGMAQQYLSIWAASSFVQSMAQITGELELQQKSLEVIIGSASYASQLFGEIRDLSQQSPYTFQDLMKSTRQLAAFGIETKDLYGTMKALSDIGAGLSVDVQRLILAFGHVRSYGYLSGIQNRQFETAGVDLIGALTDRYNKLADAEERAGRAAEHVTRKDVFKKMSKRDISFEDVNAVIMDLAQPGGRFYNMQERQYETLGGKLRNLRNNYNIMMAEMGESTHGMLMGGVNALNELTGNWSKYARIITSVLVPLGALKLANMALNTTIGLQTNAMSKNIVAMVRSQKAMEAMNASAVKRGFFSPFSAFGAGWSSRGSFTPGLADAKSFTKTLKKGLSNGTLSKTNLMYMGLSGDLPEQYRRIALALAGVRGEQMKTMASANALSRAWMKAKMSAAAFGASLRGLFAATIANPMTWIIAAVSALTYLWERSKSLNSAVENAREKYGSQANQDVKNIDEVMNGYNKYFNASTQKIYIREGGQNAVRRVIDVDEVKLEGENVKDILDDLKKELQAHAPLYDADVFDIESVETEAGRVEAALDKLESHRYAKQVYSMIPDRVAQANRDTGSAWFNDTFAENANDYQDAMRELMRKISMISETEYQAILPEQKAQIEKYQKELGITRDEAIAKYLGENNGDLKKWSAITVGYVTQGNEVISQGFVEGTVGGLEKAYKKSHKAWGRLIKDTDNLANEYMSIFKKYFQNDAAAAEDFLITSLTDLLNENKVSDPDVQRSITEYIMNLVQGGLANLPNVSDDFKKKLDEMFFLSNVKAEYQKTMESSNINWASSREEVDATSKNAWQEAFKRMIESSNDDGVKAKYRQLAQEHMTEYAKGAEQFWRKWHPDEAWKNRFLYAIGENGQQTTSDFAKYFQKEVNEASDYYKFWFEDMKKKYDEYTKELANIFKPLRQKWGIEISPDIKFSVKDLDKLKKVRDSLQAEITKQGGSKEAVEELDAAMKRLDPLITMLEVMKKEGIDFDKETKKSSSGRGTYKDKEAEVWEQRIRLIQEARREYDYWEKAVGKSSAQDKVKKQFENLVGTDKILKPGDLDNMEKYAETLRRIETEVKARYEKDKKLPKGQVKDTKIANDIKLLRELANAFYNINKMEFEKSTERFVSGMSNALEELTRRWEIFNAVREKIGNDAVSMRVAGFTPIDKSSGVVFKSDAMKAEIDRYVRENTPSIGSIDFGKMLGLGEKELSDEVHKMFREVTNGLEEGSEEMQSYERKIKAIVDALKEWQKAEKDTQRKAQEAYADALDKAMDYASQVERINVKLEEQVDLIEKAQNLTRGQKDEAIGRLNANAAMEREQASAKYSRFFNDIFTETKNQMDEYADILRSKLNEQFRTGGISAQKYAEELDKIDEKMRQFNVDNPNDWFNKGPGGIQSIQDAAQLRIRNGIEMRSSGIDKVEEARAMWRQADEIFATDPVGARKLRNDAMLLENDGQKLIKAGNDMIAGGQKTLRGAKMAASAIEAILQSLEQAQEAFNSIKDAAIALGKDEDSWNSFGERMDTMFGALKGIGSAAKSFMSGDFIGGVFGLVSTAAKTIGGIAKNNDADRQRRIENIQKSVERIEHSIDMIRKLRENELGYAKGATANSVYARYRYAMLNGGDIASIRTGGRGSTGMDATYYARLLSRQAALVNRNKTLSLGDRSANIAMAEYWSKLTGNTESGRSGEGTGVSSYMIEYNALLKERQMKMQQYNEESKKKKQDGQKLEEWKGEIADLDIQISQFAENLLNELWGIDFKSWAGQISDALMTAFENGTSAAKAFDESVNDILRNMVKDMMQLAIIEPFMERIKREVLGYTDENGVYHAGSVNTQNGSIFNDPSKYASTVTEALMNGFREIEEPLTQATTEYLNSAEDMAQQYGWTLRDSNKGKSGSNSISQTITEETAGYMTGILAAIHQDGSFRRLQLNTIVTEQMPNIIDMMTVSGNHIAGIDENTRAIMYMMQEGSGRLYERVDYIGTKLDRFASGFDRITVS